jgi:anti-sigma B factor antagonist
MIPFKIEIRETAKGICVVGLSGRLNAASAPETKDRLKALAKTESHNLVLDLAELSFVDSSGLAAFVAGYKAAAEAGGSLKLASLGAQVAEVFALTRLDRVFEVFPDAKTAVESFAGSPRPS